MAFQDVLDDLTKRNNSFYPTDDNNLHIEPETPKQVTPVPITESRNGTPEPANTDSSRSSDFYADMPQNLTRSDYDFLLQNYPKDVILKHYNKPYEYEKNGGFLTQFYESTQEKPKPIDERKVRNAKIMASLGDAATMLIDMVNSKGARIPQRDYNAFPSAKVGQDAKDLNTLYREKMDKYRAGLYDANVKDFLHGYQEHQGINKGIQSILSQKRKLDADKERYTTQMQYRMATDQRNYDLNVQKEDNLNQHRAETREIQRANLAINRKKAEAQIKRWNKGGTSGYEMRITANEADNSAVRDELNERVKIYNLTKEQVEQYSQLMTRLVTENPTLFDKYPELGTDETNLTNRKDMLARAYVQFRYDKQHETPLAVSRKGTIDRPTDYDYWDNDNYWYDDSDLWDIEE